MSVGTTRRHVVRRGLAAGALSALAISVASTPAAAANHSVSLAGFNFAPSSLTIQVGDTVTWTHDGSSIPHSVTADDGSFDSNPTCPAQCMGADDTFQHTFSQPGTYAYHCEIHNGMKGTITVT